MPAESGDDLEGFDPTTPAPVIKKGPPRGVPRQTSRAVAGPSKPPTGANINKKASKASPENEDSGTADSRDVVVLSSDDEGRKSAKETVAKSKGKESTTAALKPATQLNGKVKSKGKGKADSSAEAMQVDEIEQAEPDEAPTRPSKPNRGNVRPVATPSSPPPAKRHKGDAALEVENTRLRRKLEDVIGQRDRLSEQVKEALEVRETEPERLMAERIAQYETNLKVQQQLLQEQSSSLGSLKAFTDSGHLSSLHFITRDAAAEEHKKLIEKVRMLEQQMKEKDAYISDLKARNQLLDRQLDAEVKMAKEYREKNPPASKSTVNGPARGNAGSLDHDIIKLYQDLSNLLISKVVAGEKPYTAFPDLQEKTFHCTYTHMEAQPENQNPSLQFTLRHAWAPVDENSPVTSRKDLRDKMEYIPVNLENESADFKERLGFFKAAFIFERDQMHVFMKTLTDALATINEGSQESGEENQIDDSL